VRRAPPPSSGDFSFLFTLILTSRLLFLPLLALAPPYNQPIFPPSLHSWIPEAADQHFPRYQEKSPSLRRILFPFTATYSTESQGPTPPSTGRDAILRIFRILLLADLMRKKFFPPHIILHSPPRVYLLSLTLFPLGELPFLASFFHLFLCFFSFFR